MGKKLLLEYFINHKVSYSIGILFLFLSSYIQTLFPKILGMTIDTLKVEGFQYETILSNITFILLIALGTFVCTFFWRRLVIGNARKLECHLRECLFSHFQKMSVEFYSKRRTGDLITYAINDITAVRMAFGPATAMSTNALIICIASIYSMCISINPLFTLLTLSPLPLVLFLMLKIGKQVQIRFKKVQENFSILSGKIQENIYGIRVIKSYVQEKKEINNFDGLSQQMMDVNIEMAKTSASLSPLIELCFSISFVINLIIGGKMVLARTITIGDFVAFNSYLMMIMAPILSIGRIVNIIQRGMASLTRLNDIFSVRPDIEDENTSAVSSIKGEIEFKGLNFAYPGTEENVLKDINLKIPAGHTLGIIGKTGSGKTTLVNLLFRLYNVGSGKITIDGRDINDYPLNSLRESFGFVPQDIFLFSATIKENINFFSDIYSDDELIDASRTSQIHDSIIAFPDGYHTMLGERGVNLSGGQKQRVAIARAIIKDPAVLILDDALSAVDTVTEAQILKKFKNCRNLKTNLIISHRISAIVDADEIIVMDQGRICEKGAHAELLRKGGIYFEIYTEQIRDQERGLQCEAI